MLERPSALKLLSASIPRTINDAIDFVRNMGYRFLWVDSLCIVQDDDSEKHDQISIMHKIYSAAYATIVQHTGNDANAGLPGVRLGSRSMLATKVHIDETILIAQSDYSVPFILSNSLHGTRGWTMQEVLLSSRCLHFFDKQVTFVCTEKHMQDWNAPWLDIEAGHRTQISVSPRILWQMNPLSLSCIEKEGDLLSFGQARLNWLKYFEIYARIVANYTTRHLSYYSDILNAFQGLAGAISGINASTFFFGLPSVSFDFALLWIKDGASRHHKLQPSLPTWSWALTPGRTRYNICNSYGDPSAPFIATSYIKEFSIISKGRSVPVPRMFTYSSVDHLYTPYVPARQLALEPAVDVSPAAVQSWPEGTLHFWAEECPADQFSAVCEAGSHSYLYVNKVQEEEYSQYESRKRRCGVMARPPGHDDTRNNGPCLCHYSEGADSGSWGTDLLFILMSECNPYLTDWGEGRKPILMLDYEDRYNDGKQGRRSRMFNVLLVRQARGMPNGFVERVVAGQVHMLAWLRLQRRRRYIRMI